MQPNAQPVPLEVQGHGSRLKNGFAPTAQQAVPWPPSNFRFHRRGHSRCTSLGCPLTVPNTGLPRNSSIHAQNREPSAISSNQLRPVSTPLPIAQRRMTSNAHWDYPQRYFVPLYSAFLPLWRPLLPTPRGSHAVFHKTVKLGGCPPPPHDGVGNVPQSQGVPDH